MPSLALNRSTRLLCDAGPRARPGAHQDYCGGVSPGTDVLCGIGAAAPVAIGAAAPVATAGGTLSLGAVAVGATVGTGVAVGAAGSPQAVTAPRISNPRARATRWRIECLTKTGSSRWQRTQGVAARCLLLWLPANGAAPDCTQKAPADQGNVRGAAPIAPGASGRWSVVSGQ